MEIISYIVLFAIVSLFLIFVYDIIVGLYNYYSSSKEERKWIDKGLIYAPRPPMPPKRR